MSSPHNPGPDRLRPPSPEEYRRDTRRLVAASALGHGALDLEMADIPRLSGTSERTAGLEHLQHHLIEISADPSGSDPRPYLSPETLEVIADFERIPVAERWRDAIPITHDDLTFRWLKKRRMDTPVLDERGQQLVGRRVGYLGIGQFETPVLYCSDRSLRMLIKTTGGHGHGGNTYSGYCRLPDPAIAAPVRNRGAATLVQYKHQQTNTLRKDLGLTR